MQDAAVFTYPYKQEYRVPVYSSVPGINFFIGTGGGKDNYYLVISRSDAMGTASVMDPRILLPYSRREVSQDANGALPATPADMLKIVRETFSLNVKQAAQVFDVERPTIYLWATTTDAEKMRAANFERMRKLHKLAEKCGVMGQLSSGALRLVLNDGSTLLDQLSIVPLDESRILSTWGQLGAMKDTLTQARQKRSDDFAKAIVVGVTSLSDKEALKQDLAKRLGKHNLHSA